MQTRFRSITTLATVLMVLALSAMWTMPAFADDSTPPTETPALPEVLDQLPEGTEVVVTDSAGEVIPLASEQAATALDIVDPMWCPAGVTPFGAGCSIDYASLEDLVADVGTGLNPTKAGTIWIEAGPEASANPIVFNKNASAAFTTWSAFDLTFQGGWSGLANKTVNSLTPSELSQSLYIEWIGNVTLKDLVINPSVNDAFNYTALYVVASKNILLERVTVEDANNAGAGTFDGAVLSTLPGGSNVTINNSNFQNNEGFGLSVYSRGIVTTNNLAANLNGGNGATIDNSFAYTDKAVTMKGLKQFNNNGSDGLLIYSDGAVTISNVVANNNLGTGVYVDNRTSIGKLGVTMLGSNSFVGNVDGLIVQSRGTITANNITATDNNGDGVTLDNCDYNLGCQADAKLVKLSGVNIFNNNGDAGLVVDSFGAISISNITASNNGYTGAILNNLTSKAITLVNSTGTVTLTGYGIFNNNDGDGLFVASYGNFTAANVTANYNYGAATECGSPSWGNESDGCGVFLYTFKAVTFSGTNNFNYNTGIGLFSYTNGKTTASNVTANSNGDHGVYITSFDPSQGVTLTGSNNFNNNTNLGLYIFSTGIVTLSNVSANFNGEGAYIYNSDDPAKPYNVTLTGSNSFNDNDGTGLQVSTFGTILINNLTADYNGQFNSAGYGVDLNNCLWGGLACDTITPKTVTLTGSVNANGNYDMGLYISSLGAITMTNVTANDNGLGGARISNNYNPAKPQAVTLKGTNFFNGNAWTGLEVHTYGLISLNNVTANWNGEAGAYLNNDNGNYITAKTITLTGVNSFIGNAYDGLYILSSGAVVLNRVNADYNDGQVNAYVGDGIYVEAATGSITLVCGHTFLNEGYGYNLNAASGAVIIKGIYSYANLGGAGFTTLPVTITLCALP